MKFPKKMGKDCLLENCKKRQRSGYFDSQPQDHKTGVLLKAQCKTKVLKKNTCCSKTALKNGELLHIQMQALWQETLTNEYFFDVLNLIKLGFRSFLL